MYLSGFDEYLKTIENNPNYLYAGYSAGICVLAKDMHGLEMCDEPNINPYGIDTMWNGLGYFDYIFLPHYKSNHKETELIDGCVEYCDKHNSISNNDLKENDMLPSIRNLAKDLRISILTVKKAYDELEQEAYIKTVQGKGTFITPRNKALIREKQISIIEKHIEQIVDIAKISNISKEEVMGLFNYIYEEE